MGVNKYDYAKEALYDAIFELCDADEDVFTRVCSESNYWPIAIIKDIQDLAIRLSALSELDNKERFGEEENHEKKPD